MKAINKVPVLFFALLISLCSCQKDALEKFEFNKKEGDNDGPILAGLVLNSQENPVHPATVALFPEGLTTAEDSANTDTNGNFKFFVEEGSYFLKVYENNILQETTGLIEVTDSSYIQIDI